jgi:hypothetical protein
MSTLIMLSKFSMGSVPDAINVNVPDTAMGLNKTREQRYSDELFHVYND